jgi:hypothetical protein
MIDDLAEVKEAFADEDWNKMGFICYLIYFLVAANLRQRKAIWHGCRA